MADQTLETRPSFLLLELWLDCDRTSVVTYVSVWTPLTSSRKGEIVCPSDHGLVGRLMVRSRAISRFIGHSLCAWLSTQRGHAVAFQFGTAPLVESRMVIVGTLGTIAVDATLGGLASF